MRPLTKLRQGEFVVVENCAFIGSCTGGKLLDLTSAAEVLKGRHVAPGVDMFVVPASFEVRQKAEQLGYVNYP